MEEGKGNKALRPDGLYLSVLKEIRCESADIDEDIYYVHKNSRCS